MRSDERLRGAYLCGDDHGPPTEEWLRAGPLTVLFVGGDLRYVRLNGREVLRRIYVAVRDADWNTVPARLSNVLIHRGVDTFRISYDAEHRQDNIDFQWHGHLESDSRGSITFIMTGLARSTFLRNRIGLCVLHPMRECAETPCIVEQSDGSRHEARFPRFISAQQPFLDVRAITHEVFPGVHATVRFAGDVFETEDQRNWTDASYKTYSTPLARPYPAEIAAGTEVRQSVTLSLKGRSGSEVQPAARSAVRFSLTRLRSVTLPQFGLGAANLSRGLTSVEASRLRALELSHLRVDLRLVEPDAIARLRQAASAAADLGVALEVALFLSDAGETELDVLTRELFALRPPLCSWLLFHGSRLYTLSDRIGLARDRLARYDPRIPLAVGSNAYFAELNRHAPDMEGADAVVYPINPQVHSVDNASMVENLEAQAATVESARRLSGGRPVFVSPVTLKPRFNPSTTRPDPYARPGQLPSQVDVRQLSLFGAGWTLGSVKYLAESGARSITYYETIGWLGVMESAAGSPLPEKFPSTAGAVFPLYHILADLGEFAGGEVLPSASSQPLLVDGLALQKAGRRRTILANLSPFPQAVFCESPGEQVAVHQLDGSNVEEAVRRPEVFRARPAELLPTYQGWLELEMPAYAVVTIDN